MPIYTNPDLKEKIHLLNKLKGKSCFHIKSIDKETEKQISKTLKLGYKQYKKIIGFKSSFQQSLYEDMQILSYYSL